MSFNKLPVEPTVRTPAGLVKVNGTVLPAWTTWTVDSNNFFSADSFRVTFVLSALPDAMNVNWWGQQKAVEVEILAGFPADPSNPQPSEMRSLIVGHVDDIDLGLADLTLEITGRDLSAQLIDTKTAPVAFRNQTSSDIALQFAKKYGLTPQVTPTTAKVGVYWDMDHVNLKDQRSEWDILCYLASQEDFIVSVKGRTLYFGSNPFGTAAADHFELPFTKEATNTKQLHLTRSLTIAKGVTVTAFSYQTKNKHKVEASYPRAKKGVGVGRSTAVGGTGQNYRINAGSNKTVLQVQQLAEKRYREIVAHEVKVKATLPADHALDITKVLKVTGSNSTFDTEYYPDSIVWSMSLDSGYTMEVSAKNVGPFNSPNI